MNKGKFFARIRTMFYIICLILYNFNFVGDNVSFRTYQMKVSRKFLASRTSHLGLSLEAYQYSNMFFPQLEDSIIFGLVKKENNQTKDNIIFWLVNFFPFLIWKIIQCDSKLCQVILKRILNCIVWKLNRKWGSKKRCRKLSFLFLLILSVQSLQTATHYSHPEQ